MHTHINGYVFRVSVFVTCLIDVPSSKHWTMFPMKGIQVFGGALITDLPMTPEQMGKQLFGTPRLSQHPMWFLPPAPHLISLWNSAPQMPTKAFNCDILALYEHNGMHTSPSPASVQHWVTLYCTSIDRCYHYCVLPFLKPEVMDEVSSGVIGLRQAPPKPEWLNRKFSKKLTGNYSAGASDVAMWQLYFTSSR